LDTWDELPCFANQEQCDAWRKKWAEGQKESEAETETFD